MNSIVCLQTKQLYIYKKTPHDFWKNSNLTLILVIVDKVIVDENWNFHLPTNLSSAIIASSAEKGKNWKPKVFDLSSEQCFE